MITSEVENFPGFPEGILGPQLMADMREQAIKHGTRMVMEDIADADFSCRPFKVTTTSDEVYEADSVIIASGQLPEGYRWILKKGCGVEVSLPAQLAMVLFRHSETKNWQCLEEVIPLLKRLYTLLNLRQKCI
jgi:predicted flavoprotein YhiN